MSIKLQSIIQSMTSTRKRLFWSLQISGSIGLSVLTYLTLTLWYTINDFILNNIHTLAQSILVVFFSLILRQIFLTLWDKPIVGRMVLSFIAVLLVALLWNLVRIQLYILILLPSTQDPLNHQNWVFDKVTIFFNFGTEGKVAGKKTFYWDDVTLLDSATNRPHERHSSKDQTSLPQRQVDLPITFDDPKVIYSFIDFDGTNTSLNIDPVNRIGRVAVTTKNSDAEPWAGTTASSFKGLASAIPINIKQSKMSVRVLSPSANTPVRLKLENHDNSNQSIETEVYTTKVNTWEVLIFDFNNNLPNSAWVWRDFGGWYFTALLIFMCWSALYHGIKYALLLQTECDEATNQAIAAKLQGLQASETAKEAQLQMLRYQLNPHFLFNTLNAIYALIKLGDKESAKAMVAKLSKFLRYSLDINLNQLVSLSHELDALNLYLEIEKVRFGARLELKTDIEPAASLCLVPSLILQPLVENAIKYAIAEQENGGTIAIEAFVEKNQMVLIVSDDGPGVELINGKLPHPSGIGLCNTQKRLETLFEKAQSFTLEQSTPHGLRIVMRLPYQKH